MATAMNRPGKYDYWAIRDSAERLYGSHARRIAEQRRRERHYLYIFLAIVVVTLFLLVMTACWGWWTQVPW